MRSRLAIALALSAAGLAVEAAPVAGEVGGLTATPASVDLFDCSREARAATFQGRMKPIEGSDRLWMRFTLLEKRASGFEAIAAPGLGRWQRSRPGVAGFGWRQTVRALQPGATYRMQVDYRWYAADGELLARTRRRSAACRQFGALPNLTAALTEAQRTTVEGVVRYRVEVKNIGVAAAVGAAVRLAVDGGVVDTVTIASLGPGESRLVGFRGPQCRASVSVAADPDGLLAESSETDNAQQRRCADLPELQ